MTFLENLYSRCTELASFLHLKHETSNSFCTPRPSASEIHYYVQLPFQIYPKDRYFFFYMWARKIKEKIVVWAVRLHLDINHSNYKYFQAKLSVNLASCHFYLQFLQTAFMCMMGKTTATGSNNRYSYLCHTFISSVNDHTLCPLMFPSKYMYNK